MRRELERLRIEAAALCMTEPLERLRAQAGQIRGLEAVIQRIDEAGGKDLGDE